VRIEQEFFEAYMAIYRPYINRANSVLSTYKLYSSQWLILKDIEKNGTTTSVDVSRRRGIEKPTATKVIKHLLELGLIQSHQGEDRRIKYLTMTEEGKRLYDEVSDKMNQMQQEVLKDFEIDEVQELIASLRRMNL
jgi:DNA-binding MarR family transcriptional regulator